MKFVAAGGDLGVGLRTCQPAGRVLKMRANMIHPATELRHVNDFIGYGVFATAFIPAGSITWVRDELDQTFTPERVKKLPRQYRAILDKYTFTDAAGGLVLCWDHARFVNHSCEATCLSAGYDFEIAVRDLQPGDELTDDYGSLNLREDFVCACRSPRCRRIIRPDDLERHAADWDAKVEPLFRRLRQLPQPLWPFLREREAVEQALANRAPYRSIRLNQHHYA
jgi:hypothetical protein